MPADLEADISAMDVAELLAYQQDLTRTRLAASAKGRDVQAELDHRAQLRAAQRAAEDAELGQVAKPPTQQLLGPAPAEAGS